MKEKNIGLLIIAILLIAGLLAVGYQSNLTGFASKNPKINVFITVECSLNPEAYLAWRIKNTEQSAVDYSWALNNSSQNGGGVIEGKSEIYVNTSTIEGSNLLILYLDGEEIDSEENLGELCEIADETTNQTINQTEPPLLCVENWICGNWTECADENQTRVCLEENNCNTTLSIPVLIQACVVENQTNQTNQTQETNETAGNETLDNETSEPVIISNPASDGGGGGGGSGGGGSSSAATLKMTLTQETIPQKDLTKPETLETGTGESSTEVGEGQLTGFVALAGSAIRDFFEERGIDYRIGIGVLIIFIVFACITLRRFIEKRFLGRVEDNKKVKVSKKR